MSTKERVLEDVKIEELLHSENVIVLFNDDVNTFDHVIETLVKVCKHEPLQAEQCALIVHYKGKCDVKSGTFHELVPMCTALLDAGLSAEIH
ncbi:ATP-dependent Clp protease adaptor ClpS [Paenimyroides aestuarii]|uniref:ATP-dependent Clp protease adaptor ClpS n=1 Tax=Paenimyroides aestuarii TaxID=2968490 RepID=A0ABY5NRI5_9FLAO|nr:ATP-dependent Clp protease adaptor ClpS [Paenimyroides aestuarii]UUV21181.1 ATP-dependent Clp protease adaptor ClpS [Paenimyroides aestuarii]